MRSGIEKRGTGLGTVALAGGILLLGSGVCAAAQANSYPANPRDQGNLPSALVGTWSVTVTQINCQTGSALGAPFHSLLTFAVGGTMSGVTSNPAFLAGQRSGDLGVWSRTGIASYSALTEALISFTGGPFTAGSQTIAHGIAIAAGGDAFTDNAQVQFYDASGNPLMPTPGCAAASGQRLQLIP